MKQFHRFDRYPIIIDSRVVISSADKSSHATAQLEVRDLSEVTLVLPAVIKSGFVRWQENPSGSVTRGLDDPPGRRWKWGKGKKGQVTFRACTC